MLLAAVRRFVRDVFDEQAYIAGPFWHPSLVLRLLMWTLALSVVFWWWTFDALRFVYHALF